MGISLDDLPPKHRAAAAQKLGLVTKQPTMTRATRSPGELMFELQCEAALPDCDQPVTEYRFHESRKWRFDFAWPDQMLAVEIEGLTHDGGRHQRIAGFIADLEKYEQAMIDGWTVYRVSASMVKSGRALEVCERMLTVLRG